MKGTCTIPPPAMRMSPGLRLCRLADQQNLSKSSDGKEKSDQANCFFNYGKHGQKEMLAKLVIPLV